jgi:glycerol-3-phosphate dehydrogenase (NAD(P)+)
MTATDDQSRNRMVGLRLGKGEKLSEIIASLGSTAEGASSAELVLNLATKHAIEAPIVALVVSVLRSEIKPQDLAQKLMSRPLREEF